MANHHFGEIGDVWKHLPLGEILAIERPLAYWETHSGSASYALDDAWTRDFGVGRFLRGAADDAVLSKTGYYKLVSAMAKDGRYPGSPLLAMKLLGRKCRDFMFCDTNGASIASVQDAASGLNLSGRTRFFTADGIDTVWRFANNTRWLPPSDNLIFIDPFDPHSKAAKAGLSAIDLTRELALLGYKVVYWYGFDQTDEPFDRAGWAWRELSPALQAEGVSTLSCEVKLRAAVDGPSSANPGIRGGCGLFCANLSIESFEACCRAGRALAGLYEDAVLPSGESGALEFVAYQ